MTGIYRSEAGERAVIDRYRELLDSAPFPTERITVPTRQGDTFVLATGPTDAPPVVLLHGSGGNTLRWSGYLAAWRETRRVYAVDCVGEPGFSAQTRPPLDRETYALWLDDVLGGLGLTSTDLVGESLGGWKSTAFAVQRPQRVRRLVLLNPGGFGKQRIGILFVSLLSKPFGTWGRRRSMSYVIGQPVTAASGLEFALLTFREFKPRMEQLPSFEEATLRQLRMPVLVLIGARDVMIDAAGTEKRMRAALPHADVRVLRDAGHLLPDQTEPIMEFLTTTDAEVHDG